MGLTQPRRLEVCVDEDGDLYVDQGTWGYAPDLVLTIDGKTGQFEIKTNGWSDAKTITAIDRVLQVIAVHGNIPQP